MPWISSSWKVNYYELALILYWFLIRSLSSFEIEWAPREATSDRNIYAGSIFRLVTWKINLSFLIELFEERNFLNMLCLFFKI